ncbi:MAG: 6-phosphogluconolactonase, partial [Corallococcus sp.]|nr:6-phosphogluconolactonase [Corallococcus sp.]
LSAQTVCDNSRMFDSGDDVPPKAVTVGIADIMKAKKIVLLASGANKAEAVRAMVRGSVGTQCPASVLQTHPDVTVICDKEAAQLLDGIY